MLQTDRITNITDQIEGFAQEVASTVENIMAQYNLDWEQAMKVVSTGVFDMMTEVLHHELYELSSKLEDLSDVVDGLRTE